jgi:hypothetical protein
MSKGLLFWLLMLLCLLGLLFGWPGAGAGLAAFAPFGSNLLLWVLLGLLGWQVFGAAVK